MSAKYLDHNDVPEVIDHVGWRLFEAYRLWKEAFVAGMVGRGYLWFSEARANLIPYMEVEGMRQAELVKRSGLTKQAVQQLLDELVADGILARVPDPADRRGNFVVFTAAGQQLRRDANTVKRRIERVWRRHIGDARFNELVSILKHLPEPHAATPSTVTARLR
jgi:DNA-binding MarR family transcriptional regulator